MRAVVLAAILSLAALVACTAVPPADALKPHENPDVAPVVFDGVSLFQKYLAVRDYVLAGDYAGVERLQNEASYGNIPPELRNAVNSFMSSGYSLAQLTPGMKRDLDNMRTLLSQFRPVEAQQSSEAMTEKLSKAYSELQVMEKSVRDAGRWWRVNSLGAESALRKAYEEVEANRSLLDSISEMRHSLTQQSEILWYSAILKPTTITLSIKPETAFVGDIVEFQGILSSEGKPLANREVTILLNGSPALVELTDSGGTYEGQIELSYQYISEMTLQAIYYPQGPDIGAYLGSSSARAIIKVLFYDTRLTIQTSGTVFPGRKLILKGSFDYGSDPVPERRQVQIYWDDELVAEVSVAAEFTLELPVPEKENLGQHQVALYVPPQERYAPTWGIAEVEVVQAAPLIELDVPKIVLLPFALNVTGKAHSIIGPVGNASLKIILGNWEATTRSLDDGTFEIRLSTGITLTLVGIQKLQVNLTPEEPWHRASSLTMGLLVINPVNIAGLALAISIPAFFSARRIRKRGIRRVNVPVPQLTPALVRAEDHISDLVIAEPKVREEDSPGILFALYRGALWLVQRATAVLLKPSHTLREFAQECAPKLGPFAIYFRELTLIIERLLYSPHRPTEDDATRARQVSHKLKEGFKSENA